MSLNSTLKDIAPENIIEASKHINKVGTAFSGINSTASSMLKSTAIGIEAVGRTIKSRDVIFIPGDKVSFETLSTAGKRILDILVDCKIVPIFFSQRFLPTLGNFVQKCILAAQNNEKSKKDLQTTAKNTTGLVVQLAIADRILGLLETRYAPLTGFITLALQNFVFPWLMSGTASCPYSEEADLKAKMNFVKSNELERKIDQKCRIDIMREAFFRLGLGHCMNSVLCAVLGTWLSLALEVFLLLKLLESANFFEIN